VKEVLMELEEMVRRARAGDLEAFEAVTRRFQQMAFGSALALVRDLQQAEDIVQETFVAAWFALPTLAEPAAFPGWLRSDPLTSRSRLFEEPMAPAEHAELASRVRGALALLETPPYDRQVAADERTMARAEKLRRFFGQPFFAAERYTHRPGVVVPLAESLRVCREILDGDHDDVPTEAFFFTGGIDEIRSQEKSPAVTSP
jgi:Sigma-70 region 2